MANPRVFFDLSIDSHPAGRIVMELFADNALITVKNFPALCTGENGIDTVGKPLHYKGSSFHHVIPRYMVHGTWSMEETSLTKMEPETEWLDRKQVVFSEMVQGFDVLKAVDQIGSSSSLTSKPIMVIDCDQLC
ncbi:hypothetical protein EZV62_024187 [Acer yangbiense]|uniref:peptidylprolyl isomerase n=1 Tax=Acer yangbiense TaxID=1000413 RepID=A0A5C7H3T8_9ROSI|nr:hypothetical protein EZV62_024187 [Acer yangbiense]